MVCSSCSSWTKSEQQAFRWMVSGQAFDGLTTEYALDMGFEELNPILDDCPSDVEVCLFKAGSCLLLIGLGEIFPESREDFFKLGAVSGFVCGGINTYQILEK